MTKKAHLTVVDGEKDAYKEAITTDTAKKFQYKWRQLLKDRAKVDHEMALLAAQIRDEFPAGDSGNYQFRRWCREFLETSVTRTTMLLEAANAIRCGLQGESNWIAMGGWPCICFIMGLAPKHRLRVWSMALKKANDRAQPHCYTSVRAIAYSMGIMTARPGRPTRTQVEKKLSVLRKYIAQLHEKDPKLMQKIPPAVKQALKPTALDMAQDIAAKNKKAA